MAVGLDLTKALRVGAGGSDMRRIGRAGATVWASPLLPLGLYGTGVGQVPVHLSPARAVLDGTGKVLSLPNAGGAGAAYDATTSGTVTRSGNMLAVNASYLALANPVNGVGMRAFWVIASDRTSNIQVLGSNKGNGAGQQAGLVWYPSQPQLLLRRWNGTAQESVSTSTQTIRATPTLIEVEILAGQVRLWVNGALRIDAAMAGWTSFPVEYFGMGYSGGAGFNGAFGHLVWLSTDGGAVANAAALTIRQILAAEHGIAVT